MRVDRASCDPVKAGNWFHHGHSTTGIWHFMKQLLPYGSTQMSIYISHGVFLLISFVFSALISWPALVFKVIKSQLISSSIDDKQNMWQSNVSLHFSEAGFPVSLVKFCPSYHEFVKICYLSLLPTLKCPFLCVQHFSVKRASNVKQFTHGDVITASPCFQLLQFISINETFKRHISLHRNQTRKLSVSMVLPMRN